MAFARGKLHIWNFKKWIRFTVYALTPQSLNVKLGSQRKGHKGRAGWLA